MYAQYPTAICPQHVQNMTKIKKHILSCSLQIPQNSNLKHIIVRLSRADLSAQGSGGPAQADIYYTCFIIFIYIFKYFYISLMTVHDPTDPYVAPYMCL